MRLFLDIRRGAQTVGRSPHHVGVELRSGWDAEARMIQGRNYVLFLLATLFIQAGLTWNAKLAVVAGVIAGLLLGQMRGRKPWILRGE